MWKNGTPPDNNFVLYGLLCMEFYGWNNQTKFYTSPVTLVHGIICIFVETTSPFKNKTILTFGHFAAPLDANNTRFSAGTLTLSLLYNGDYQSAIRSVQPLLNWQPQLRFLVISNHTNFWDYQRNVTDRAFVYSYFFR